MISGKIYRLINCGWHVFQNQTTLRPYSVQDGELLLFLEKKLVADVYDGSGANAKPYNVLVFLYKDMILETPDDRVNCYSRSIENMFERII